MRVSLYYRLRLKEVIDEMKPLVMTLSGVLSDLETCYGRCLSEKSGLSGELKKVEELREIVKDYLDRYLMALDAS